MLMLLILRLHHLHHRRVHVHHHVLHHLLLLGSHLHAILLLHLAGHHHLHKQGLVIHLGHLVLHHRGPLLTHVLIHVHLTHGRHWHWGVWHLVELLFRGVVNENAFVTIPTLPIYKQIRLGIYQTYTC